MPGTRAQPKNVIDLVQGYSNAATTAAQILTEYVSVCFGRISGIKVLAVTAGTGGGNTVVDILLNGTSVWAAAGNKPTLAALSTGEFANAVPDSGSRGIRPGDRLTIQVASISSTGHARLMASIGIEANA
jgi:hypothetical protein